MWALLLVAVIAQVCPYKQDRYGCVPFTFQSFEQCYPKVRCYSMQIVEVEPRVVHVRVDVYGGDRTTGLQQAKRACAFMPKSSGVTIQCRAGKHHPDTSQKRRFKVVVEP